MQNTHCKRRHMVLPEDSQCMICQREARRRWREANREKSRASSRSWREANPEKNRTSQHAYIAGNLEKVRATDRRCQRLRRALKESSLGIWDDDAFIERQLFLYQNGKCFYCGTAINLLDHQTFHLDHCTPLIRGGLHCATNVVLSCPPCNWSKGDKTAEEFFEAAGERCDVHRHLKIPELQKIIDMLEKL